MPRSALPIIAEIKDKSHHREHGDGTMTDQRDVQAWDRA